MYESNEMKTMLNAGMLISTPQKPAITAGIPYVVRPGDAKVEDLERLLPAPTRIRENVNLHDPESFVQYVTAFAEPGSVIFFDADSKTFRAVLDYHQPGGAYGIAAGEKVNNILPIAATPQWGDHKATLALRATPEWSAWTAANKQKFTQVDFGRFLEDHLQDVADGHGDALEAVAKNLQVRQNVTFNSAQRLDNGATEFLFNMEVSGTVSGAGTMEIPATFDISIQPYQGGPIKQITCRFRYRLQDRALVIWYEMVRLEKAIDEVTEEIRQSIEEGTRTIVLAGEVQ